jgi:type IV pilus assembly protein PilC
MHARSRVLKMLGILLSAEMPAPQALAVLADSGYFEWEVERRLEGSRRLIEQGEPLAKSLYRRGLLTAAMAPLVDAAERARNLPWALAELGDHLAGRTAQMIERITKAIFPLVICGLGLVVGFMVVGMFLPMIEVIGKLGQ